MLESLSRKSGLDLLLLQYAALSGGWFDGLVLGMEPNLSLLPWPGLLYAIISGFHV